VVIYGEKNLSLSGSLRDKETGCPFGIEFLAPIGAQITYRQMHKRKIGKGIDL
jgi:hypothetical protein